MYTLLFFYLTLRLFTIYLLAEECDDAMCTGKQMIVELALNIRCSYNYSWRVLCQDKKRILNREFSYFGAEASNQ